MRAHRQMLDRPPAWPPGGPARTAVAMINSVDVEPAPLRTVLGSQPLDATISTLGKRLAGFQSQPQLAASGRQRIPNPTVLALAGSVPVHCLWRYTRAGW
jgi:hypothetical protein